MITIALVLALARSRRGQHVIDALRAHLPRRKRTTRGMI
jgi:hypothetical protein